MDIGGERLKDMGIIRFVRVDSGHGFERVGIYL